MNKLFYRASRLLQAVGDAMTVTIKILKVVFAALGLALGYIFVRPIFLFFGWKKALIRIQRAIDGGHVGMSDEQYMSSAK